MKWISKCVCLSWLSVVFLCVALTSHADITVGVGETLSITNVEDIGNTAIYMDSDSSLFFSGTGAASAGLNEYIRTGITSVGTPYISSYGTWGRFTTNVFWAATNITATQTEYIYTGRWYVPDAGLYSFYEHIDDQAAIALDGNVLFRNTQYNVETCVQNVQLEAGWHSLEVRVYNGAVGGGPYGSLEYGIMYSPSNDLISASNLDNAYQFVDPGDGSVLQPVHNGFLYQNVYVDGDVTFDLSELDFDLPFIMTGGALPQSGATDARITVTGDVGEVVYKGSTGYSINYPFFNVDMAFSGVADPKGLTFKNQSTVVAWPTSCVWQVADDATVALGGSQMLGSGDVFLTNHNIYVLSPDAVDDEATIHVQGTNLFASIKPCTVDDLGYWHGFPATFTNDVSLEGMNAQLNFPLYNYLYLQGSITGTGTVYKTGSGRVEIYEPCDFVGTVDCGSAILVFDSATAGDSNNTVRVGAGSTFALYPLGSGSILPTETWIKYLDGYNISGKIFLPENQRMTVDYFNGTLSVDGESRDSSVFHINTLESNAIVRAIEGVTIEIDEISPGASVILIGENTGLKVTGADQTLDKLTISSGQAYASGDFNITTLEGSGTLVKEGASTLEIAYSTLDGVLHVAEGTLNCDAGLLSTNSVLGSLPSLWLDAAADGVFTQYDSYTFTNGFEVIERWEDWRPDATGYALQTRGEGNWQTYPYLMTNVLNRLNVLSTGSYQTYLSSEYEGRLEARRMPLDYSRTPEFVVMVMGSQDGGGAAVLGGGAFTRNGTTAEEYRDPATPILDNGDRDVWIDGAAVDGTTTGLSGGYQIFSIDTDDQYVNALGWDVDYHNAGGQNYAEVLLFTNELTTVQRVAVESYLARKWGLPYAAFVVPSVSVDAGATFVAGTSCMVSNVMGSGNVVISDSAEVDFIGMFTGTVQLDGGDFVIPDVPDVPGDEAVPLDSLCLWVDPCMTNRAVLGEQFTPTRPLAIAGLFDRTTDDRYLLGTCSPNVESAVDRRPWLSVTNGPFGTTQHWIDFENIYGETRGNTLRLNTNTTYIGTDTINPVPTDVQTGFIVVDSSRGGGAPILHDVFMGSVIRRDNPQDVNSPIWGSGTTASLRSGETYLDGLSVDGATHGYSGRNELLSFVATNPVEVAYFGYYGADNPATPNRERLGEIILFDSALDESTRTGIEAYLMKKWLGKGLEGYVDVTMAEISGSGTVNAIRPSQLPVFDSGFTGEVNLSGSAFDYTVSKNANDEYEVTPSPVIPGTLSVPATGTITVDFDASPSGGSYSLISFGSITGDGFNGWSLVTTGDIPQGIIRLAETDSALVLQIIPQGSVILLQ